jgi:hypothetical protein
MPTINLVKTTDSITTSGTGGTPIARELYTGTFTDTGTLPNPTHRQGYWPTVGRFTRSVNNGKPSRLMRDTSDFNSGAWPAIPAKIAVAWGVPGSTATDGYRDEKYENSFPPDGQFTILCCHCSFANLALVGDAVSFAGQATLKWIQVDGLKHFNIDAEGLLGVRPVHAFPITGDIPDWYVAAPTHMAGEVQQLAPFVPTAPVSGWYPNPNDPTTSHSARYINGELCTSFFPSGREGNGYIISGSPHLYLGSSYGGNPSVSERFEIFNQTISTGFGTYRRLTTQAQLPWHRGTLPNADLRIAGFATSFTSATLEIRVGPVVVWSEAVVGPNIDFTRLNVTLSTAGLPSDMYAIFMSAALTNIVGTGVEIYCVIVRPVQMYGCNPAQSSDWPECVPGFVRRVAV